MDADMKAAERRAEAIRAFYAGQGQTVCVRVERVAVNGQMQWDAVIKSAIRAGEDRRQPERIIVRRAHRGRADWPAGSNEALAARQKRRVSSGAVQG